MQYRTLGQTGLRVSTLGFGCAPLGGNYGATTQTIATQAVRTGLELGINFFDTSPWYGNSEEVLGIALAGVARESYVLCTKLGRYPDGSPSGHFDFSVKRVRESVTESLRKLKVETLDIVHCHDIEFAENPQQIIDETLPALRTLVAEGKVRFLGVSGLPLAIFPFVLDQTSLDVVLSYCHCSLNDDSLFALLPYLTEKNVGVIGASPLAMGLLSDSGPQDWHPAPISVRQVCVAAAMACHERGVSLGDLALAWTLQNAPVATTLVGMGTEELVRRNVVVAAQEIAREELAVVEATLAPIKNTTWPSGLPQWQSA